MDTPLISTKLSIPIARPGMVPRARLTARLDTGLSGKLTLVSAPAGYGKTTLLAGWLHRRQQSGQRVAWLTLDSADSDPARFIRYIVAALRQLDEHLGETTIAMLDAGSYTDGPTLLTPLVNEMAQAGAGGLLLLDDYHVLHELAVHEAVAFLIEHLPPQFHLVISTREDPPLPLARLRARAQLSELRVCDMRFTSEEATCFLEDTMGLNLAAVDVATIHTQTEGWIAGLQLAALSLRDQTAQEEISGFITALTGSHRYILDYLMDEVFNKQPSHVQAFLLHTCIVDRMCAPLCDALLARQDLTMPATNVHDSAGMLHYLERSNLFLTALDPERHWFRYHHLFADLLHARLKATDAQLLADLHRRAAVWYAENGMEYEAVDHALEARDYGYASGLISQSVATLASQPRSLRTLLRWMQALPASLVRSSPRLSLDFAWVMISSGHRDEAEEYASLAAGQLKQTESEAEEDARSDTHAMLGESASILTLVASHRLDIERAAQMAKMALDLLPERMADKRAAVSLFLADAYSAGEQFTQALQMYGAAEKLGESIGDKLATFMSMLNTAAVQRILGHLHLAAATYRRAMQLSDIPIPQLAGMGHIGLGEVLAEWGELDEAAHELSEGIERLRLLSDWNTNLVDGYTALARVRRALGDAKNASLAVQQLRELAAGDDRERIKKPAEWAEVMDWLASSDLSRAGQWAEMAEWGSASMQPFRRDSQTVLAAQVYIALGNTEKARYLLDDVRGKAAAAGRHGQLIHILALQSVALYLEHRTDQGMSLLRNALALAEPEGYVLIFVEQGAPMAALLREAVARGISPGFAARLLLYFTGQASEQRLSDGKAAPWNNSMPDALSEREMDVLRLLISGLSGPEIASTLTIGQSTVKSHMKSIFSKLGVHSRDQAIARARELRLF